mgnify:CR=1 FL=1
MYAEAEAETEGFYPSVNQENGDGSKWKRSTGAKTEEGFSLSQRKPEKQRRKHKQAEYLWERKWKKNFVLA